MIQTCSHIHLIQHLIRHLSLVPAHRALVRALESQFYEKMILAPPILDVGCGDGYFARAALHQSIDVGIDLSPTALTECASHGIYRTLLCASGAAIPFPDRSFATVMSNCVLEHVPQVEQTIHEINRVLKPGGSFIGTMVTDQFSHLLGIPRLLRTLRLQRMADAYTTWFNHKARHLNMLSLTDWSAKFTQAGLHITQMQFYLGPKATRVFDWLHYYALPSAMIHALCRRWLLWQDPRNVVLLARLLQKVYNEDVLQQGSCVFIVAIKPSILG